MSFELVKPKLIPPLEEDFRPAVLANRAFQQETAREGVPLVIGLIQGDPAGVVHKLEDGGLGGNHVAFRVPAGDFDRSVETLKKEGVTFTFLKKRDRSWSAYFLDPDGNKLELTAWPLEDSV